MDRVEHQFVLIMVIVIAIILCISGTTAGYKSGYNKGHEEGYVEAADTILTNLEDIPEYDYFTPCEPLYNNMHVLFDNYPHKIDTNVIYDTVTSAGKFSFVELLNYYIHEYGISNLAEYPN